MTGNIINNGTEQFTPIIDKLGDITTEFVPYLIYIAIGILGITITITAVKYIINYLKLQSEDPFNTKRFRNYEGPIYVGKPEETKEDLINEYNEEYEKTLAKIGQEGLNGTNDGLERITLKDNGDIEYTYGAFGDKEIITNDEYDEHTKERIKGRTKRVKMLRE